jgi:GxxExxY protein
MAIDSNYKHSELTDLIIGVFYEVYTELGFGFLESVYRNSLRLALLEKALVVEQEVPVTVYFRGRNVGDFRADLVVNGAILLELKTADHIVAAHESQVLNYLRSTSLELGLILNFGPNLKSVGCCWTIPENRPKSSEQEEPFDVLQISAITANQW